MCGMTELKADLDLEAHGHCANGGHLSVYYATAGKGPVVDAIGGAVGYYFLAAGGYNC